MLERAAERGVSFALPHDGRRAQGGIPGEPRIEPGHGQLGTQAVESVVARFDDSAHGVELARLAPEAHLLRSDHIEQARQVPLDDAELEAVAQTSRPRRRLRHRGALEWRGKVDLHRRRSRAIGQHRRTTLGVRREAHDHGLDGLAARLGDADGAVERLGADRCPRRDEQQRQARLQSTRASPAASIDESASRPRRR